MASIDPPVAPGGPNGPARFDVVIAVEHFAREERVLHSDEKNPIEDIVVDAAGGLLAIVLVLLSSIWIERTPAGRWVGTWFTLFAMRSTIDLNPPRPSANVISIAGLKSAASVPCPNADEPDHQVAVTNRASLEAFVKAIASNPNALPASIGIDVDFGRCNHKDVLPADPAFFRDLLAIEAAHNQVFSIFVGVLRGTGDEPQRWLIDTQFAGLAGLIGTMDETPQRAISSFAPIGTEGEAPGYGMAYRLAYPHGESDEGGSKFWSFLRDKYETVTTEDGNTVSSFPFDPRALPQLTASVLRMSDRTTSVQALENAAAAGEFSDKIVLFGTVDRSSDGSVPDGHDLPGFGIQPGALILATAADSLRNGLIYDLKGWWRVALDVASSLLVLGIVLFERIRHLKAPETLKPQRLAKVTSAIFALAIVIAGVLLLAFARVMWTDALLVALVLAAHPHFEGRVPALIGRIRDTLPKLLKLAESEKESRTDDP